MSRNRKRIDLFNKLINKNIDNPYKIEDKDNRKEVEDVLIEKSKDFKKVNVIARAKDLKKDNIVINRTFKTIRNGFLNTKDKEGYIKANAQNFKQLKTGDQQKLLKLFMDFIQ